jgi:hypothetical protein
MATENIPSPIVCWLNFFQFLHIFGCQLSNWQWIDFHHWFGDEIWSCLVIKCKPCMSIFTLSLGVCGPCVVSHQPLSYTLGGRGETFMGVWISDHHIVFAIGAKFQL